MKIDFGWFMFGVICGVLFMGLCQIIFDYVFLR